MGSAPDTGLPPIARHTWLTIIPLWGGAVPPTAYEVQLEWLARWLNQPPWERWWDAGRSDEGSCLTCAIGELVRTLENGGRIRIPAMIAEMRDRYGIPATSEDARLLAHHGYSSGEIATALA